MSTQQVTPRHLTEKEQETFRRDFQDKEREIQRYIGVYLSGLVIVTGWVIGPQSRPILAMALGNDGYNVYAFLIFLILNIVFTNFLIYKSLIIHEITQFMTYLAKPNSAFLYWDSWRRSPQSATKPVRSIYTISLSILPICASFLMMYGVWNLLYTDPSELVKRLVDLEHPVAPQQTQLSEGNLPNNSTDSTREVSSTTSLTPEHVRSVFWWARIWFWVVAGLHLVPFYFLYVNTLPTKKRWTKIHRRWGSDSLFKELNNPPGAAPVSSIRLYDKGTNRMLGEITREELKFLRQNLEEEHPHDRDYHLNDDTIDLLEKRGANAVLLQRLRNAMGEKKELEIELRTESQE